MSAPVVGSALVPGSQMRLAVTYMRTTGKQMLTERLGSIAMVARVRVRRVGHSLRDAGRERPRVIEGLAELVAGWVDGSYVDSEDENDSRLAVLDVDVAEVRQWEMRVVHRAGDRDVGGYDTDSPIR